MIVNPRKGMHVQVWYNKRIAPAMPLHGKVGVVTVVCRARHTTTPQIIDKVRATGPRNHGVMIDGQLFVIPCGNLRKPNED